MAEQKVGDRPTAAAAAAAGCGGSPEEGNTNDHSRSVSFSWGPVYVQEFLRVFAEGDC